VLLLIASWGGPLVAHHSFSMFEMDKNVTYTGVVVDYMWNNPHVHFTIDVKPASGIDQATVGRWDVEGGSTNIMTRQGWNRATLKPAIRLRWLATRCGMAPRRRRPECDSAGRRHRSGESGRAGVHRQ
jgi:hypothetical protein